MKRFFLMIISVLICGGMVFISSCSEDEIDNSALSIYISGQSTTKSATFHSSEHVENSLWCTGEDIKWYNATTGELKLKNTPNVPIMTFSRLTMFLDNTELFSIEALNHFLSHIPAVPFINWEPDGEWVYKGSKCGIETDHIAGPNCEPIWEYNGNGGRYIISLYPIWPQWYLEEMSRIKGQDWVDIVEEREVFELHWNMFIEQLKKEGKYRE